MTHLSKAKPAILAAAILMLAAPSIAAAQSSAPLSGLYACEAISDSSAQLACFRAETAKLRAAETSGDVIAVEKETFSEIKKAEVEAEVEKVEQEKTAKKRTLVIASTSTYGGKGYTLFTLENGEVWKQIQPGRVRLNEGEVNSLTIKRASFGSFLARVNDKGKSVRVRRAN